MRQFSDETADSMAYGIIAMFQFKGDFPGCDALGLNPDNPTDKITADAIVYAIQAGKTWAADGDNSNAYGRLSAMISFGIVDVASIKQAHHTLTIRHLA